MAKFRLSRLAEADLMGIGIYTLRTWGVDQTIRYIEDLESCCQQLPTMRRLAALAVTFAPVCAAWSRASTLCFSDVSREVFSFPASCMNACCRKDTPLITNHKLLNGLSYIQVSA